MAEKANTCTGMGTRKEKKNMKCRYEATIAEENAIFSNNIKPEFKLKPEVAHPCIYEYKSVSL